MIKIDTKSKKLRRKRALSLLRQLMRRRKKTIGYELLIHAHQQIVDEDLIAAKVTLERYELVSSALSKDEVAILQCIRDSVAGSSSESVWPIIVKATVALIPKMLISVVLMVWHWAKTHIQIYFIEYYSDDPLRTRGNLGDAFGPSWGIVESGASPLLPSSC